MNRTARWLESRRSHRRIALVCTGLCCLAVWLFGQPSLKPQLVLASAAIVLFGVPHGAFDAIVAARVTRRANMAARSLAFLFVYAVIAAAMVGLWLLSPPTGLLLFLLLSWSHFGRGDRSGSVHGVRERLEVFVRGGLPLLLPVAFHRGEVELLFNWLTGLPEGTIRNVLDGALPILLTLLGSGALVLLAFEWQGASHAGDWPWAQAEMLMLALTFFLLPPLLGFAIYFSLWHSARHLIALDVLLIDAQSSRGRVFAWSLPVVTVTLLLMAICYWALAGRQYEPRALVQVLFVSLAALTLPHMFVTLEVDRGLSEKT